jgi:hypothetical protein
MMKVATVSLRVPQVWQGRVDSRVVRRWLHEYFERRFPLPEDPGPGEGFLRLSLPKQAVKVFSAVVDDSTSAALRRLIASHLVLPAPRYGVPLLETRSGPVMASFGSVVPRSAGVLEARVVRQDYESQSNLRARQVDQSEVSYWASVVRDGMNFCRVPEHLRPAVARLCPDALCGTLPAGVVYRVPGYQVVYGAVGAQPYQVGRGSWAVMEAGVRRDWSWIVWLALLLLLVWWVGPWRRQKQGRTLELPAPVGVSLPGAFTEWIPK